MSRQIENISSLLVLSSLCKFYFPHFDVRRKPWGQNVIFSLFSFSKNFYLLNLPQAAIKRPHGDIFTALLLARHVSNLSKIVPFKFHSTISVLFDALIMKRPVQAIPKPTITSDSWALRNVSPLLGLAKKPSFFSILITSMQFSRALWIKIAFESGLQVSRTAWSYSTLTRSDFLCWVSPILFAVHNSRDRSKNN